MGLSTHVLDITRGKPAEGIAVVLEKKHVQGWVPCGHGTTDKDGRIKPIAEAVESGLYRLHFDVAAYLGTKHGGGFYPEVIIVFEVKAADEHYHVPLLLSPFGYSTYRGS
jgi:5-hydroxyisourate hydrolase